MYTMKQIRDSFKQVSTEIGIVYRQDTTFDHFFAVISPHAKVADTCVLGNGVHLERCELGPNVIVGDSCYIHNGAHIGRHTVIGAGCSIGQDSTIRNDSTLGAGVLVPQDVHLPNGTQLPAGSMVAVGAEFSVRPMVVLVPHRYINYAVCQAHPEKPLISIGCIVHTVEHWHKHIVEIAEQHEITTDPGPWLAAIDYIASSMGWG